MMFIFSFFLVFWTEVHFNNEVFLYLCLHVSNKSSYTVKRYCICSAGEFQLTNM